MLPAYLLPMAAIKRSVLDCLARGVLSVHIGPDCRLCFRAFLKSF